jgi:sulfur carrier protein ThiS
MHRGSSKGARPTDRVPEILPLSASPPAMVRVELEVARAGRSEHHSVEVPRGSTLRAALRLIGQAGEGCAVLEGQRPVPLDLPLVSPSRFTVVPTFSGG